MGTINLNIESKGFLDCINALNLKQSGYGGHRRIAFGKVYDYSLKTWKDAYVELCEQHQRHITYQEYIDWMNSTCLVSDASAETEIAAYEKFIVDYEAASRAQQHRDEVIRAHRAEFENACDDLLYGYGFHAFFPAYSGDLSEEDAKIIWRAAFDYMSKID